MSPALIAMFVEEAVKLTPGIIVELRTLFAKKEITEADWAAFKATVASKSYEDYVPASDLPKP